MAKKKRKISARAVGRRIKSKAGSIDFVKVAAATGGGFAAAFAIDKLDDIKTKDDTGAEKLMFADKPLAAPLIVEAAAVIGTMFVKDETAKAALYGAMGGAGAQMYAPVMDMMDAKKEGVNGTNTIDGKEKMKRFINRVGKRLDMHKAGKVPAGGRLADIQRPQRGGGSMADKRRQLMSEAGGTGRVVEMSNDGRTQYRKRYAATGSDC